MTLERDAGLQALQQGNPAAAAPLLETACQQNPADFDALLFLGAAYGQIGRQMDAINTITKAVQVQPANAQARYNLAVAMEQGGYRDQAITALGQALTLQPDYPKAQEALRRLQGGEASIGTGGGSMDSGSLGSTGYGQSEQSYEGANSEYRQAEEPAGISQPAYGQQTPPQYGAPAANPYASQQGSPHPYATQQPPANPYAQPGMANPYAPPPLANTYPPGQGPYPYAANPGGGYMAQSFQFNPEYAGFGARFAAMILDGVIFIFMAFVVLAGLWGILALCGLSSDTIGPIVVMVYYLLAFVGGWLYFALFESSAKQATPGKQALGIIVSDLDGNRIGFGRATGRHFAKILSQFLFIGYIMAAFTDKKQGLHDMIASTLIVRR